ncbi:hypothetical protein AX16_005540 [Volvariella volvacea WC 439]|nr:hypothetical protein AX16_005540 [Volvariella volvacea WC 439]
MFTSLRRVNSSNVFGLILIEHKSQFCPLRRDLKRGSRFASTRKAIKSKKTFSELPSVYLRPDGTPAPPLEGWRSTVDTRTSVLNSATPSNSTAAHESIDPHVPKPRTTRRKSALTPVSGLTLPGSTQTTRKRRGKPQTKTAKQEKDEKKSLPKNQLSRLILENLDKYPNHILLTRVGQFYESYFKQAIEVSQLLGIKLTSRQWDGQCVEMCGFPLAHLDKHLKTLVLQQRRSVALCEEFSSQLSYSTAKEFERRVVRVVTPGTLIDETFLNPDQNNYLLSIGCPVETNPSEVGLAWIDVSTGEFLTKPSTYERLRDDLARISPREVVLDDRLRSQSSHPVFQVLLEEPDLTISYMDPHSQETALQADSPSIPTTFTPGESCAISLIAAFLKEHLLEHMPTLPLPSRDLGDFKMQIDSHTYKALEIREAMTEGGVKGSLMSAIKRTATKGGSRLLARWLSAPSTSTEEITTRQSIVSHFLGRPHLHSDLVQLLKQLDDCGRIIQKFLTNRGEVLDLLAITRTINLWNMIRERILEENRLDPLGKGGDQEQQWLCVHSLILRVQDLSALSSKISNALHDESTTEGLELPNEESEVESKVDRRYGQQQTWYIKPEFSKELLKLHSKLQGLLKQREDMERELQSRYSAPSLTLRSTFTHGMLVHLAKAKRDKSVIQHDKKFASISESNSTHTYFYQPWAQLGAKIVDTSFNIEQLEKAAFASLRTEVVNWAGSLRQNAQVMDELDVILSFASLAAEMGFVKPTITNDVSYRVIDGCHPTVQQGLLLTGRVFTPNTVELTPESNLHIITGPNMAGKSTVLRQTALIAILAQIGSFVPAEEATIGIVDQLFSRVGAKDDLFRDRSTFMVEMVETAEILRRATPRSLVIMDEVGRGTTVKDGLAIAYATLHHLATVNQCRTLFATHFHELVDMVGYNLEPTERGVFRSVDFYCTDVIETEDERFAYSYGLKPGVNRDSHGLKVAHLAGMPPAAMEIAKATLDTLKS